MPTGKPVLRGMAGHVSIAHSGSSLVLVLANAPIGVDCEIRRRERPWVALAARYFPAREATLIAETDDPGRAFLLHWVAKEALLKCLGLGIAGSLGCIELDHTPENTFRIKTLPRSADPGRFTVHVQENNGSFLGLAIESTLDESRWKIDGIDEWTTIRHGH